jgi:hypothetical protein
MTDIDPIEQRLRRTFRAVAEQPVAAPESDTEPWLDGGPAPRSKPRVRVMAGALVVALVIVAVALGVAYGPRSSNTPTNPISPVAPPELRAVFAPSSPQSTTVLRKVASTMQARLNALGDTDVTVTVKGDSVEVNGRTLSVADIHLAATTGALFVRPVLCGAPAQVTPAPGVSPPSGPVPECQAQDALTASNLAVDTTTGVPANIIPADPTFSSYPNTSAQDDDPAGTVLLRAASDARPQAYARFVLGPAQLNGSGLSAVSTQELNADQWEVDLKFPTAQWDTVAQLNFHQYVAIDLDGQVLSAPLIEPQSNAFVSFRGQLGFGSFTATEAKELAAVLGSGPLPVTLRLQSLTHSS